MVKSEKAAIGFEAVKIGLKQDSRGHILTLLLHPHDLSPDLLASAVKTRYAVKMIELDEHEQPVTPPTVKAGERAVTTAGMLSRNQKFQTWASYKVGATSGPSEIVAADYIRSYCGIDSRSELATNHAARGLFERLEAEFLEWVNGR